MKKAFSMLLALLLLLGAASAGAERYSTAFLDLFDTVVSVVGYEDSREAFDEKAKIIHDGMARYHQLYDIYSEYEGMVNLCTLNTRAGETLAADPEILALIRLGKEACDFSGGKTDITLGALLSVWHVCREAALEDPENAVPADLTALEAAAAHKGFDSIEIDEEQGTIRFTDPELRLDVGSLAKGYALQRVADGIEGNYLISAGGSVYATAPKPDGSPWVVGVQNPDGDGYLHKLNLYQGAVVTSGDYIRYYMVDGVRYHHIIDPDTLYPGTKWRSVTVICDDSGIGDALTTTLFLLDREEGEKVLEKFGAEACWMDPEGQMYYTEGYKAYMQ